MSNTEKKSPYPEHVKLQRIHKQSQAIYDFLGWCGEHDIVLCELNDNYRYMQTSKNHARLLSEHFGIDQNKLENEKRAMIESIRGET